MRVYFHDRLAQFLTECGGSADTLKGWQTHIICRPGAGAPGSVLDVLYISPKSRKHKSRVEVASTLNLLPYVRNFAAMPKSQLYCLAQETREKHLVSQLLGAYNGKCDGITSSHGGDVLAFINQTVELSDLLICGAGPDVTILSSPATTSINYDNEKRDISDINVSTNPTSISTSTIKREIFFSYGNTTVLNWGTISPLPGFHTSNQLYPIGFKCIRQEHDIILDRVVDCLCEILAVPAPASTNTTSANTSSGGKNKKKESKLLKDGSSNSNLVPLFRITVCWMGSDGKVHPRVYEGSSPKQVWMSVQLEEWGISKRDTRFTSTEKLISDSLGDDSSIPSLTPGSVTNGDPNAISGESNECDIIGEMDVSSDDEDASEVEPPDEEEIALRKEIMALRKRVTSERAIEQQYYIQQKQSGIEPTVPFPAIVSYKYPCRLMIGEGTGISDREKVAFGDNAALDSLIDPGLHRLLEGMQGVLKCSKYVFADARGKNGTGRMEAGRKSVTRHLMLMQGKIRLLDRIIRKQAVTISMQQVAEDARKKRIEEIEIRRKAKEDLKNSRIAKQAQLQLRRLKLKEVERTTRLLRENLLRDCQRRRAEARVRVEIIADREEMWAIQHRDLIQQITMGVPSSATATTVGSDTSRVCRSSLPDPPHGPVGLPGDSFGKMLELWGILTTYGSTLGLQKVPSIEKLVEALRASDRQIERIVRKKGESNTTKSTSNMFGNSSLLNALGQSLCKPLVSDFNKILGIDIAEPLLGPCKVPVNSLTWREIVKIVLLAGMCKEAHGWNEVEVQAHIRGRGHSTAPDSADRRCLKLIRRRLLYKHYLFENAMTSNSFDLNDEPVLSLKKPIVGYEAGVCLRIPYPKSFSVGDKDTNWPSVLKCLLEIPSKSEWRIKDIIRYAINSASLWEDEINEYESHRYKSFRVQLPFTPLVDDGSNEVDQTSQDIKNCFVSVSDALKTILLCDYSKNSIKWMDEAYCVEESDSLGGIYKKLALSVLSQYEKYVGTVGEYSLKPKVKDHKLGILNSSNSEMEVTNIHEMDSFHSNIVSDTGPPESKSVTNNNVLETIVNDQDQNKAKSEVVVEESAHLSVAMKRCYTLLTELMAHPQVLARYLLIKV